MTLIRVKQVFCFFIKCDVLYKSMAIVKPKNSLTHSERHFEYN